MFVPSAETSAHSGVIMSMSSTFSGSFRVIWVSDDTHVYKEMEKKNKMLYPMTHFGTDNVPTMELRNPYSFNCVDELLIVGVVR